MKRLEYKTVWKWGWLLLVWLAVLLLNVWTPMALDDYTACYSCVTNQSNTASVGAFWQDLRTIYRQSSGRSVAHVLTRVFACVLGKPVFNVANSLVFMCLLWLLVDTGTAAGQPKVSAAAVLLLLLLLMPGFGKGFLWLAGACDYLWPAVFLLLACRCYRLEVGSKWLLPLFFLCGLLAGWGNEALAIGFCAGFAVDIVRRSFRQKSLALSLSQKLIVIGFAVGAMLLLLAPGNFRRLGMGYAGIDMSVLSLAHKLLSSLYHMNNLRIMPLALVVLGVLAFVPAFPMRRFLSDNLLWIVAAAVSFVFLLFTGYTSSYSRFGIELYSLIILLRAVSMLPIGRAWAVACGCAVLDVAILLAVMYYSNMNYKEYQSRIAQIERGEDIIQTEEVRIPALIGRMMVRMTPAEGSDYYSGFAGDDIVSYYYQRDLRFLPKRFMEDLECHPDRYNQFSFDTDLPFYVREVHDGDAMGVPVFLLRPCQKSEVPLLLRPVSDKMERFSAERLPANVYTSYDLFGRSYLFVGKNALIDSRVIGIEMD